MEQVVVPVAEAARQLRQRPRRTTQIYTGSTVLIRASAKDAMYGEHEVTWCPGTLRFDQEVSRNGRTP